MNSVGDKGVPCGSPASIGRGLELWLSMVTLSDINCVIIFSKYLGVAIVLSLYINPGCQTLSNAWDTSKSVTIECFFSWKAVWMYSVILSNWCAVEIRFLKPNWWFGIASDFVRWLLSLFKIIFQII